MPSPTLTWTALGDSFTAGTGDLASSGGWLKRLARRVDGQLIVANHAVPGATLEEVISLQLPLAAPATIVSAIAGANNLLKYRFEPDVLALGFEHLVSSALTAGERVVLSTCPDFFTHRHGPGSKSSQRVRVLNEMVLRTVEREQDRILLLDTHAVLTDPSLWHEDGLHPNPEGHERLTDEAAGVLAPLLRSPEPTTI